MENKRTKILGIFGNVANAGQERANTDVYALLTSEDYDLKVLVNRRGFKWFLKPVFERLGIRYLPITFPWELTKKKGIKHILLWGVDVIKNNFQFVKEYLKFRPAYIHIGNEYMFKTLFVPLSLVRAKIIFRIGDRPCNKMWFNRLFWKYIISRRVNRFVCDSFFIKKLVTDAGRSDNPEDIVLYHPAPQRDVIESYMPERAQELTFGYVGRIFENKGVGMLLNCAAKLCAKYPHIRFVFAGAITNNTYYDSEIKFAFDRMPNDLRERILFIGQNEDIDGFHKSIDVHVAPTIIEESYGLVVVEAKKNHNPSIIFASGGMKELVEDGQDGFVCKEKSETALMEAIEWFITNQGRIQDMGICAYNSLAKLNISTQHFKETWLAIYQKK